MKPTGATDMAVHKTKRRRSKQSRVAGKMEIVECQKCGADVEFGDCCNACDEPSDH